jgi:hypothetical protein
MFKNVEVEHGAERPGRLKLVEGAGDDTSGDRQFTVCDPPAKP